MNAHELARKLLEGPDLPVHALRYSDIVTAEIEPEDLVQEEILVRDSAAWPGYHRQMVLVIKP